MSPHYLLQLIASPSRIVESTGERASDFELTNGHPVETGGDG